MAQSFYVTLGLIIKAQGKVLVLHKSHTSDNVKCDIWTLPGGKMQFGESEMECLIREIKEELNIDISDKKPKFAGYFIDPVAFKNQYGMVVMKYEIEWPEVFEVKLNEEHDVYKWVDYNDFLEMKLHKRQIPVKDLLI